MKSAKRNPAGVVPGGGTWFVWGRASQAEGGAAALFAVVVSAVSRGSHPDGDLPGRPPSTTTIAWSLVQGFRRHRIAALIRGLSTGAVTARFGCGRRRPAQSGGTW
jgi:hypothetical protein